MILLACDNDNYVLIFVNKLYKYIYILNISIFKLIIIK